MRLFWLKNENEEVFDLMDTSNFLSSPGGLGISNDNTYLTLNYSKKRTQKKNSFEKLKGNIIFEDYLKYNDFVGYVARSDSLLFYYKPHEDIDEVYSKVELNGIDKTELEKYGRLSCSAEFERLSYWTKEEVVENAEQQTTVITSTYPYTYPFTHGIGANVTNELPITLTNDGHIPAPIKIKIFGASTNPEWWLGSQYGKLNIDIATGQEVEIDSREDTFGAFSGLANISQFLDMSKTNFIYIPVGTSVLTFKNVDNVEVTVYEQYASI